MKKHTQYPKMHLFAHNLYIKLIQIVGPVSSSL